MRILVICDSFKGTLTSSEVGSIIKKELLQYDDTLEIDVRAISDGGEGFLDCIKQNIDTTVYKTLSFDALYRPKEVRYLYKKGIAYVELAEVVGIKDLKDNELQPLIANTYGLGYLIEHIINKHVIKKIVIGLGGSASTDGGVGMLEALGGKFYLNGVVISRMNNYKLGLIEQINLEKVYRKSNNIEFIGLTDVNNPLCGKNGSAHVFGKQKGATDNEIEIMDANLEHFIQLTKQYRKAKMPGAGAAGGTGYGILVGLNAQLKMGINYILDLLDYSVISSRYDLIITGEGKFDEQSMMGKVFSGLSQNISTPLVVISGIKEGEIANANPNTFSIVPEFATIEESLVEPEKALQKLLRSKIPEILKIRKPTL